MTKYVTLVVTDDCKKILKCENEKELFLVDWVQTKINSLVSLVKDSDYKSSKMFYEYKCKYYTEIQAYLRVLFMLDLHDDASFTYDATDSLHRVLCRIVDEKRGER